MARVRSQLRMLTCENCGRLFYAKKIDAKYHSGACQRAAYRKRLKASEDKAIAVERAQAEREIRARKKKAKVKK